MKTKISYEKDILTARIRNPLQNFEETAETIEIRRDPLLKYHVRISKPKGLDKIPASNTLSEFVSQSKSCFFCEGQVEEQTPMMPKDIYDDGRITVGEALLFPNLSGFGQYSAVCIFSKKHFIPVNGFTEEQILNVLKACRLYFQKCTAGELSPLYPSLNANYLLPAGSSILHPHVQPFLDPIPTNMHRQLIESSRHFYLNEGFSFWTELRASEKSGNRFLSEGNYSFWYTPFAPAGFFEINGIVGDGCSFPEFEDEVLQDLAHYIRICLLFYHSLNHNSFNITLFSPPTAREREPVFPCLLKICTRPAFDSFYRSDMTFFEKFHLETMLDQTPEQVAEQFRSFSG